jgi:hypothetical protein
LIWKRDLETNKLVDWTETTPILESEGKSVEVATIVKYARLGYGNLALWQQRRLGCATYGKKPLLIMELWRFGICHFERMIHLRFCLYLSH